MKLYLAALFTNSFDFHGSVYRRLDNAEKAARGAVRHYLDSYHYVHKQSAVDRMRRDGVRIFLDSGAFSAYTKGVQIDLPKYCRYIQENADIVDVASVLDGIGDPLLTWQNQQRMEQLGVRPLPCFHYGEDERYLEWYIGHYEYITLGGMVPISTPQLRIWLDRLWEKYLTDGSGRPRLKVHGFGLTSIPLMTRYPWYSVDSSSWVQIAGIGGIMLPELGRPVPVSEHSPARKNDRGGHIDNMAPIHRTRLEQIVAGYGFSIERLRTTYVSRWAFNCGAYSKLNDMVNNDKSPHFAAEQPELFA